MARRLERSDSTVTQFPGKIRLEKQWDVTLQAITSPKRNRHDDPQSPTWRKRIRHEERSDSGTVGDDSGEAVHDMLPPRLPPKLKAPESLFVPQEIYSPEEPPLDSLPLRRASPWQYYTKAYRRELGASVVVACKNPATFELFAVKCMAGSEVNDQAQALRQVRHENFLTCYEIFVCDDAIFTVSECMAISLTDLNGSAIQPNEIQIATIIHQVLKGLDFLASRDMMHRNITCSTILLSLRGDVKVANPEGCINIGPRSPEMREDTEALGFVMLQLMERGSRRRERLALEHPDKWSPQADKFLQSTASNSARELLSHTFLKDSPQKEELVRLIACAQISSHIPFCLEGS
ncbi:uncharacterized protein PAC_15251 [Phialocephala subalpina]|uniref:Protein kinase domain-containing protein n=1 Tax=Phialocephala subalpina TaxID=576137 RepID=A0A1L7XJW6_9HELO|nr:uncharacterized protein PAC_15251 [Phialocephala subalpina]